MKQMFCPGHTKQKLMAKMLLEHLGSVHHHFIQEVHNKTQYGNIFHHLEEAIPCEHLHLETRLLHMTMYKLKSLFLESNQN